MCFSWVFLWTSGMNMDMMNDKECDTLQLGLNILEPA